jgi:hypothetical protein
MKTFFAFLALFATGLNAQVKVSSLPSAEALAGPEVFPVVQSSTSKKATAAQMAEYARSVAAATLAPIDSPTFTGTPTVPGYLTTATAASTYATPTQVASSVWIAASEIIPKSTNGAGVNSSETATQKKNYDSLDFDAGSTSEGGDITLALPDNYTGGTITARFYWTADSGSGTVIWQIQARSLEDGIALDAAGGTSQTVTDTLLTAGAMHISPATSAVTIAGTPAARTPITFSISRNSAADTLAVDARLIGVELDY